MTAATKNFIIEQKATFRKRLVWRDARKRPIDLTGHFARMQIRDTAGAIIATLTTENGGITLGGALGTIDLYINVSATSQMTFTTAMPYDLTVILPNGDTDRLLQGTVKLSIGQTTPV